MSDNDRYISSILYCRIWYWQIGWSAWKEGPTMREYHIHGQFCTDGMDHLWAVSGNSGPTVEEYTISTGEGWRKVGELKQKTQKTGCVYDSISHSLIVPGGEVGGRRTEGEETDAVEIFDLHQNQSYIADDQTGQSYDTLCCGPNVENICSGVRINL